MHLFQSQEYNTMFTIVLLCLVGIVAAQQPKPCASPSQWEGRIFDSNEKQRGTVRGRISYDAIYHRVRVIEEIEVGSQDFAYDVLTLVDAGLEFIYDLRAHKCSRVKITDPWRDYGILPDAKSYGEAYIGSSAFPDTGVLITIWLISFFDLFIKYIYYFYIGVAISQYQLQMKLFHI